MIDEKVLIGTLIVDASAFIRFEKLETLAKQIATCPVIIREIKDKVARDRLAILPYELQLLNPSPKSVAIVTGVAKKTGDFASLSANDLTLAALAYEFEVKSRGGNEHLNLDPKIHVSVVSRQKQPLVPARDIAGFYMPRKFPAKSGGNVIVAPSATGGDYVPEATADAELDREQPQDIHSLSSETGVVTEEVVTEIDGKNSVLTDYIEDNENDDHEDQDGVEEGNDVPGTLDNEDEHDEGAYGADDSGSNRGNEESDGNMEEASDMDDRGWITQDNLSAHLEKMGAGEQVSPKELGVACMTSDFSIQNLLLHMGISVMSINGLVVKRLKTFVLRCHGCFKSTQDMTRKFCPTCGNPTLDKVSVSVNPATGTREYHLSARKTLTTRGLKHSLPAPKGGKYATNPILCEDQMSAKQFLSQQARLHLDVFDDDYIARDTPFLMHDVNSRSAVLGLRTTGGSTRSGRNPNEGVRTKKRGGKRR